MIKLDWTSLNIPDDHHRVFVLQWRDLFGDHGLDTWQVRTSNVRTILEEVVEATKVAEEYEPYRNTIPDLLAEAISVLVRDEVAKSHYPFLRPSIEAMAKDESALANLSRLRRQATMLLGRIRDYRRRSLDDLRDVLAATSAKERDRQLRLTMTLGTEIAASGHSLQHLAVVGSLLETPTKPFLDRFDEMLSRCSGREIGYSVFFLLANWPQRILESNAGPVQIFKAANAPQGPRDTARKLLAAQPSDRMAEVTVKAADPYSARRVAENVLANAFAAIAFTRFSEPSLKTEKVIVLDSGGDAVAVQPDNSRRTYMRPSDDWLKHTANILELRSKLPIEESRLLAATLQYYRLAVSHQTDEVRLVNLWVAAENLVRGIAGGSIVDRIVKHLVPPLASRNIRRVTRGLLGRVLSIVRYADLRSLGLTQRNGRFEYADFLRLLTGSQGDALLARLGDDPLLRYRLFKFATGPLKSSKSAADYIEVNAQNITWQFRRIYRARNALVHRGQSPTALRQLIQHLHSYLWASIRYVTEDLISSDAQWAIADALEHQKSLHEYALSALRCTKEMPYDALVSTRLFLKMSLGTASAAGNRDAPKAAGKELEPIGTNVLGARSRSVLPVATNVCDVQPKSPGSADEGEVRQSELPFGPVKS